MFWGCKIDQWHPYSVTSNGDCVLTISQISFSKESIENPNTKSQEVILRSKEINFPICELKKGVKNFSKTNIVVNIDKDKRYQIITKGIGEIHLIGNIKRIKRAEKEKNEYSGISAEKKKEDKDLIKEVHIDLDELEILLKRKRSLSR